MAGSNHGFSRPSSIQVPKLHVQVNNHLSQSVVSGLGHGQFSTDPTADGFY